MSCIVFTNTTCTATRSLRSIKSFLQPLHLMHGLKSNVTNSSCSFLTFGNTVIGISSCMVCLPRHNNWHSLPLHIHLHPAFNFAPYCNVTTIRGCVGSVLNSLFGNLLNEVKFRSALNFLLLATPAMKDKFLCGYMRKWEIEKAVLYTPT
jgi:hypothetical protein